MSWEPWLPAKIEVVIHGDQVPAVGGAVPRAPHRASAADRYPAFTLGGSPVAGLTSEDQERQEEEQT